MFNNCQVWCNAADELIHDGPIDDIWFGKCSVLLMPQIIQNVLDELLLNDNPTFNSGFYNRLNQLFDLSQTAHNQQHLVCYVQTYIEIAQEMFQKECLEITR